jgi:pilus assembly protein CpaF
MGVKDKQVIRSRVLQSMDMSGNIEDEKVNQVIDQCLLEYSKEQPMTLREKLEIKQELFNSLRRLDVLSDLLEKDEITEIMINGADNIFVEKSGVMYRYEHGFESEERLKSVIQHVVAGCNRVVNEASPIVDARLADGSRVNVVLPPVSLSGSVMTIRKFPKEGMTMERLINLGSINREVADFLRKLVVSGYNIIVSGGTGAGKTTFLNALSGYIPKDSRIVTIEDSAELQLSGIDNLVRLEARSANVEGENAVTIRDLIKTSLRMRPSRIIVGEVRDEAAIDMLTAMNTGHDGSLSTGHANSAKDMLTRLETMVLMGADMPILAIRQQIASAVDIIIQLGRMRDKSRRCVEIVEVLGLDKGEFMMNKLYEFVEVKSEGGKIVGKLQKINDLHNVSKLFAAGFLEIGDTRGEHED